MTKQMTIVVIGSLRVKQPFFSFYCSSDFQYRAEFIEKINCKEINCAGTIVGIIFTAAPDKRGIHIMFFLFVHKNVSFEYSFKESYTALDKALISNKKYLYFSYFSTKTYVVGTH